MKQGGFNDMQFTWNGRCYQTLWVGLGDPHHKGRHELFRVFVGVMSWLIDNLWSLSMEQSTDQSMNQILIAHQKSSLMCSTVKSEARHFHNGIANKAWSRKDFLIVLCIVILSVCPTENTARWNRYLARIVLSDNFFYGSRIIEKVVPKITPHHTVITYRIWMFPNELPVHMKS